MQNSPPILSHVSFVSSSPLLVKRYKTCCQSKKKNRKISPCSCSIGKFKSFFSEKPVGGPFPGRFGNWYLTERDLSEVWCYRSCLILSSISFGACLGIGYFFPHSSHWLLDSSIWLSTLSLGVSLQCIHIYAKVLKQALQVLWLGGVLGMLFVQFSSNELVLETVKHPTSLLFSGWTVISLCGLLFKEAFCYRQYEAILLTLLVPILTLGHFFSFLSSDTSTMLILFVTSLLYIYFSIRKLGLPVVSDLGDKSIFEYLDKQSRR